MLMGRCGATPHGARLRCSERNLGEPFGKRAPGVQARGISVPKMCSLTRPIAAKHLPEKGCCQAASARPAQCRSMVRFCNSV